MNNNINALVERVKLALLWLEEPKAVDGKQYWLGLAERVLRENEP